MIATRYKGHLLSVEKRDNGIYRVRVIKAPGFIVKVLWAKTPDEGLRVGQEWLDARDPAKTHLRS